MSKIADSFQQHAADPGPVLKVINMLAAVLGVTSFLGLVNLFVGVLSSGWLLIQLYGYIKYEIPTKRARLQRAEYMAQARHDQVAATSPGDLDD